MVRWLARGNLNNGVGHAGVGACGNGNNAVSNANWNIVARISGQFILFALYGGCGKEQQADTIRPSLRGKLNRRNHDVSRYSRQHLCLRMRSLKTKNFRTGCVVKNARKPRSVPESEIYRLAESIGSYTSLRNDKEKKG